MRTERVTFLASPKFKASLTARATALGISTGEYIRRKVEDEDDLTPEQEAELAALVAEVNQAIPDMAASLDSMIETLRTTREKIEESLKRAGHG